VRVARQPPCRYSTIIQSWAFHHDRVMLRAGRAGSSRVK
jgi:hypothetical protein